MGVVVGASILGFDLLLSHIVVAASIAYQMDMARKMKNRAAAAEEARKGFELVTEGEIKPLPIIYGKALVGGNRVYHNVSSSFIHTTNSANKTISTGGKSTPGGQIGYSYTNENGVEITGSYNYTETPTGKLDTSINGAKNEFLFFQQALCQGPIHAVHDVIINDGQFIDDPSIGETYTDTVYRGGSFVTNYNRAALRLDYFYNGGVDALISKNFNERSTAQFSNIAYFSAIVRLDRDEPQFNSVPSIQTLIEGRLVRKFNASLVLGNYEYSNNPVWCLLDYLLDSVSGKGLSIDEIDRQSFYDAAQICDTIVENSVYVGGKLYQPTDKSRNITTRSLPLYECNLVIDVSKPIRENVEAILQTMGDARLVWSQGKYKVILQYPTTNAQINLAATFTDDDLLHDKPVEISWPSSSDRLNYCTIRFNNETSNFKEESVSWPPKLNPDIADSQTIKRGIGVKKYLPVSGWDVVLQSGNFLNNYAVWNGGTSTSLMEWRIIPNATGSYQLSFTADNSLTITIVTGGTTVAQYTKNDYSTVQTVSVNLTKDLEYQITISASDTGGSRGAAATLTAPDGTTIWNTRSDSYNGFVTITTDNSVYRTLLAEDNYVKLETDIFASGITDYYHALAKAEEIVRTSRSAISVRFEYLLKDKYLEPGDIIKINSTTLNLGTTEDFYLKVSEAKLKEGSICEISGSRFDVSQLKWSSKPTELIKPPNLYNFNLTAPQTLTFTPSNNIFSDSPGTLSWSRSDNPSVVGYILYFHEIEDLNSSGQLNFNEIGRTTEPPFYVPNLGSVVGIFGIKAFTNSATSSMTVTSTTTALKVDTALIPPTPTAPIAAAYGDYNQTVKLSWVIPSGRGNGISYEDHKHTIVLRGRQEPAVNGVLPDVAYEQIGISTSNTFIDNIQQYGDLRYKIQLVSTRDLKSPTSSPASINITPEVIQSAKTATIFSYKRSNTLPTDNPGEVVYSFPLKEITTSLANDWSKTIPAGTDPLYITTAVAFSAANTDTINSNEWSTPTLFGSVAYNTAILFLYQRSDSITPPTVTSDGTPATYDFTTKTLTNVPTNWSTLISSSGTGKYLWVTQATALSITNTDTITDAEWASPSIFSLDGTDAVVLTLLTPSQQVAADKDGNVISYPTGNALKLTSGNTIVTTGVTYGGTATQSGLTLTVDSSGGLSFSGTWLAAITSLSYTLTATYKSITYSTIYTITKTKAGADSATVNITPATATFSKETGGTISPTSITLTAVLQNITSPSYQWKKGGTNVGTNSATYSVPNTDFTTTVSNSYSVTVTGTVNGVANQVITSSAIINRIDSGGQGSSAVNASLSKYAHNLPADANGNVLSYAAANTTMSINIGGQDDTANWSYTTSASSGITISGANTNSVSIVGMTAGTETGAVTITASKGGYSNQTLIFAIGKNKTGATGTGVSSNLSSYSWVFSTDSSGFITNYSGASATMTINNNGVDDSANWSYFTSTSNVSITGENTRSISVNGMSGDVGYVEFTATRSGYVNQVLRFNLTKAKQGITGIGQPGKTYVLAITGGNRSITYDSYGLNPQPSSSGTFTVELTENGTIVAPNSISWTVAGHLKPSGNPNASTYSPDLETTYFGSYVTLIQCDVIYNGISIREVVPIPVTKIGTQGNKGDKGDTGNTGLPGRQAVIVRAYKWDLSIPTISSVAASYDWVNNTVSGSYPSSWFASPPASIAGYTLYEARVQVSDLATAASTSFNWSSSSISAISYAALNGSSYRIAYAKTTASSLGSGNVSTSGNVTYPDDGSFGANGWSGTPQALNAGESLYQSDGIYNPSTNITTWNAPYLSSLKVGSLSAITANLGSITAGSINIQNKAIINSDGSAEFRAIAIKDSDGATILQSGGSLDFSRVGGSTKPANNANNTFIDNNGTIQGVSSGTGTYVSNDKIRSGGVNLVGNSGFLKHNSVVPTNWSIYDNGGIPEQTSVQTGGLFGQNFLRITSGAQTGSQLGTHVNAYSNDSVKAWEQNQFYCVSFWARGFSGATGKRMTAVYSNMGFNSWEVLEEPVLSGNWQRYVARAIPGNNPNTPAGELYISWLVDWTLPSGSVIDICCPKVELGTQPSSWTPSPQDTLNQNIEISNGAILGIGAGNGLAVANTSIAINNDGAISGIGLGDGQSVANNVNSVIRAPGGGVFVTQVASFTGSLKITLPVFFTDTMLRFTVEIYEYSTGLMCTIEIGGYNHYAASTWYNVSGRVIGSSNVEYPIFFGHDGSKCCIWIGYLSETWSYPQVRIRDVFVGYNNTASSLWSAGWNIGFDQTQLSSGTGPNQYSASVIDTLPGADWSKTARRPSNIAALSGNEPILNTQITIANNGALVGAGGGQVTINGLGYNGDLDATKGAPSGTYVAGVLAETVVTNAANGSAAYANLSNKLNKSAADILSGQITLQSGGMLLVGNTSTGVYLSANGLVGVQGGVNKFVLDSNGNAIFSGTLSGASGDFAGTITASAGSIGGIVIENSSIRSSNHSLDSSGFKIYNSGLAEFNNIKANGGTIGGISLNATTLFSSNYNSTNKTGFQISNNGFAEFFNVSIRGELNGGSFNGYAWPASGGGFHLSANGLLLGNANSGKYFQVTAAGNLYSPQFYIQDGVAVFSGQLSAASGTFQGTMNAGSININNRFTVDSSGNMSLISSTSGNRMEINNSEIKIYASNVLRVKIGVF